MVDARRVQRRGVSGRAMIQSLEARKLLATVPSGFVDQSFGVSHSNGTAMAFAPDGRLFTLTQNGVVRIISADGATTSTALTLSVNSYFERGLLGIAFDPDYTTNNFVYLYYTELPAGQSSGYTGGTRNRVSRFTVTGNTISAASEQLVLQLDNLSAGNHNGGAMNFGPDGKLYIATGENAVASNSQLLNNRHGKILRVNADGTIPADNPTSFAGLGGTTSGANRAIWAVGLRNPYTFNFSAADGTMFINDVGQNTWEEINIGQAGKNYGWPATEGGFTQASFPNFTQPLYYYAHAANNNQRGYAIAGGAFYSSSAAMQFPVQYQNKYFFGEYVNNWISSIDPLNPPAAHSTAPTFATATNGIVDLKLGPDGAIYYLQRGTTAGVRRIRPNPATAPAISNQPEDQSGYVGELATFAVEATGAATLTYQWQRNGIDIPGATDATYTLQALTAGDDGAQFRVVIRNSIGQLTSDAATLTVSSNAAATATIALPAAGSTFIGGQTIHFSGGATDPEDGALAASALSWTIVFHHDTHTHPFAGPIDGVDSGSFVIPTVGETAANVWYRIILTATDSGGRAVSTYRDVLPETSTFTLATSGIPAGAQLNLDGQPLVAGTPTLGVVGIERSIEAPAQQVIDGQTYSFDSWSDGGARVHTISTPATDTTFTAVYRDITAPTYSGGQFSRERIAPERPPHELVFTFSEAVSSNVAALTLLNQTTGQAIPAANLAVTIDGAAKQLRFSAPGYANGVLPNGVYLATLNGAAVTDSAGNAVGGEQTVAFHVLAGDANNDRTVNFDDLLILAQNYGLTGKGFAQGNFDYDADGLVDFNDLLLVAQNYGTSVLQSPASVTKRNRARPADALDL